MRWNKKILEITKKCESKSDKDEFCEERDEDAMHIEDFPQSIGNARVPNIIMLGKTGAGKSFFGSGLFGAEDPDKGRPQVYQKFLIIILFRGFSNE